MAARVLDKRFEGGFAVQVLAGLLFWNIHFWCRKIECGMQWRAISFRIIQFGFVESTHRLEKWSGDEWDGEPSEYISTNVAFFGSSLLPSCEVTVISVLRDTKDVGLKGWIRWLWTAL